MRPSRWHAARDPIAARARAAHHRTQRSKPTGRRIPFTPLQALQAIGLVVALLVLASWMGWA